MECKICNRVFANGKAMGGHMRSHFATLPLPPKTPPTDERESGGELRREKENAKQSESAGLTRARCKRGKAEEEAIAEEPLMSVEEVALCLIMMSKDVWKCPPEKIYKCESCDGGRVFKSAQGLGSHRSKNRHHKKSKLDLNLPPQMLDDDDDDEELDTFCC